MNEFDVKRAKILLKAARDILTKCDESSYVADVMCETAIWDEVECDGNCLLNELNEFLDEHKDE